MELKINKSEFAGFKGPVWAIYKDGKLALESYEMTRINVPFETVTPETDGEFTDAVSCTFYADTIRGAAEFLRASIWTDGAEYPTIPEASAMEYAVNCDGFKGIVKYVREYASKDQGRPNLLGVNFACKGDNLDVVATNGHILCWEKATNTADKPGGDFGVIVSNICIDAALKLVGKKGDLGTMRIKKNMVTFDGLPGYLFRGVIELEYPEFRRVIPAEASYPLDFTADRAALAEFAKRAKKGCAKSATPLVRFDPSDVYLVPSFTDGNNERSIAEIQAEPVNAEAWNGGVVAYNAGYLMTILAGFVGETVRFCVKTTSQAGWRTGATTIREGNRVAVLMPIRV